MASDGANAGKVVKVELLEALIVEWQNVMAKSTYGIEVDAIGDCAHDVQKLINNAKNGVS